MSESTESKPGARTLELEREVAAPPEEVWKLLTTSEGLRRWFPLDARVEPGESGSVWLSWGPGIEGQAPVHVWDPPTRFGWTESHGQDESGQPIEMAVDFYVETRDGTTVVRLVQSGFSDSAEWDDMYDALKDGWSYFLFNLAFYFEKHRGSPRTLVWRRVATEDDRSAVWGRLVEASLVARDGGDPRPSIELDRSYPTELVSMRPGHHFVATLPELDDSVLFVELEGRHVGLWLSTYGLEPGRIDALDAALAERVAVFEAG